MIKRLAFAGTIVAAGVLAWTLLATAAPAKPVRTLTIPALAFVAVDESNHNNSGTQACGTQVAHNGHGVNLGQLDNAEGSFMAAVSLPNGAKVKSLQVFVADNDGDNGTHAYLMRKRIENGLDPKGAGHTEMAHAHSSGAVLNTMRRFTDSTVTGAAVANGRYMYFVELVVCPVTEPFAVRVTYTR
jgi:hypothetical protein